LSDGAPTAGELAAVDELARVSRILAWLFLLGLMLLTAVAEGVYAAHGLAPSIRFESLKVLGGLLFFWYWIRKQCEPYGATFPMDFGYFVSMAGPFVALYYLWRYQRWRGLVKLGALAAAYLLTYVVTIVMRVLLS